MAAHPIVVVDHGKVEIPEELHNDPRFCDGAKLQLVPVESFKLVSTSTAEAWAEFRKLRGILAHSAYDPNSELELEKQRELETEAQWQRD